MKLKKAKIVIKDLNEIKKEWKSALKGKSQQVQKNDEIIFTNLETAAKVMSRARIEILQSILKFKPRSIYELAKILEKDFKNVHTDVKFLCDVGLIELHETEDMRNGLRPVARFSGIELDWAA